VVWPAEAPEKILLLYVHYKRLDIVMLSSPDTTSSGYSSPVTTVDSQYAEEDSSVLWMLKGLDITTNEEPTAFPAFEPPNIEARPPKFSQRG
jgi:hypothetical protein